MGACGSRAVPKPERRLDDWRVDADESENAQPTASPETTARNANNVGVRLGGQEDDLVLNCVAYIPELGGHCLTGWEDGSIRRLNWRTPDMRSGTGAAIATWKPHERAVNRLVIGKRSHSVYSCSRDTTVSITSVVGDDTSAASSKTPVVLRGHELNVSTVAVDADEQRVCSGGRDTQTIFWDIATASISVKNTTAQNVITCSTWLPREPLVAQGSEDLSVKLWDPRTPLRVPAQTLRGFVYFPLSIAAYRSDDGSGDDGDGDGTYLLTSSKGFNGVGCEVRLWDRRMGKQLLECRGHQQDATACCFLPAVTSGVTPTTPGLSMLPMSASKDGTVKVWDASTCAPLAEAHAGGVKGMLTGMCVVDSDTVLASTFGGQVHAYSFDRHQPALMPFRSSSSSLGQE